ncbi:ORC1-type DNA replication protein [Candidatus Woesearchaeota archaeon]|nr:ORC1-type DNA replication protein [Candidatus Woesearchaeota archaeon]
MSQKGLVNFFENFLNKQPIFKDKKILQTNFTPGTIPHRDEHINQIAQILAPCLRLEKPSNLFIYGKTGTGKTVSINFVKNNMMEVAKEKNIPIKIFYINCKLKKNADTEYRLIAQIIRKFGTEIPPTGLPTDEVYKIFYNLLNKEKQNVVIILDEIDQLVKKTGDEILYNLTRINSDLKDSQVSIIGISNDLIFRDSLDPRVISSLSEEEIIFPPYNALQIQDILKERAKKAFNKDTIKPGVIEKCAAYAAREHGDARRALELLRVSAELAERKGNMKIELKHIDEAEEKIDCDRVLNIVKTHPKQHQAVLFSTIMLYNQKNKSIFTGEIYDLYKKICSQTSLRPLTQRRVSDVIAELDMLGIINASIISKGRYGRTREISLAIPSSVEEKIKQVLAEGLALS